MTQWLFLNGSPRINGKSARVIKLLKLMAQDQFSDVELLDFEVARRDVTGCNGCEYCEGTNACIIEDDMEDLLEILETVDRIFLVTPTYFAGLPSQMKAVIDRFQQIYWRYMERRQAGLPLEDKRPLELYILGDGGDPHGYDAVETTVKSGFAIAGFAIDHVVNLTGIKRIGPKDLRFDEVAQ